MDRFWLRMTHMYGHKWVSSYGEEDDGTWRKGLSLLTPEQIGHGITECLKREEAWPPTLPEFLKIAKPNTPAYHKSLPTLPAPEIDRDAAAKEIEKMRSRLASEKGMTEEEMLMHRARIEEQA
jgi:hypothetical protein